MDFNEYQRLAVRTANRKGVNDLPPLLNVVLGLNGEAGEIADKAKKVYFQGHSWSWTEFELELGDVLWYLALGAELVGVKLEEIAEMNIEKLRQRYPDGFDPERSVNREDI